MARTRNVAAPRKSAGGFMLGMIVGVGVGLAVALAVAFYLNKGPMPFVTSKFKPAEKPAAAAAKPGGPIAGLPQGTAPVVATEKPKFDFYKILPGQEETVSDRELRERMRTGRNQPDLQKDIYFVQAGSFQNPADADNQKARLAILGFESSVEPAHLPDKGTWYRVRLGPYSRLDEINRIRQALAQNGIDASLVKIKESQ